MSVIGLAMQASQVPENSESAVLTFSGIPLLLAERRVDSSNIPMAHSACHQPCFGASAPGFPRLLGQTNDTACPVAPQDCVCDTFWRVPVADPGFQPTPFRSTTPLQSCNSLGSGTVFERFPECDCRRAEFSGDTSLAIRSSADGNISTLGTGS